MDYEELREAAQKIYSTATSSSFEYPDSKDKLFDGNSPRSIYNVCITETRGANFAYSSGYLIGAKLLSRMAIFTRCNIDQLIYPIIFMYRHYLEIILKDLIRQGLNIKGETPDQILTDVLNGHNLMKLWNKFKPFFEEVSGRNESFSEVRKGVESYLNQINKVDPESMAFRYEKTKDRSRASLSGEINVNIVDFCNKMEKLTGLLEGVSCEFSEAESWASEMRSEQW